MWLYRIVIYLVFYSINGSLFSPVAANHVTENRQLSLKCSCHFVTVSCWHWEQGFRLSETEVRGFFFNGLLHCLIAMQIWLYYISFCGLAWKVRFHSVPTSSFFLILFDPVIILYRISFNHSWNHFTKLFTP